jgi:hypothetical protein
MKPFVRHITSFFASFQSGWKQAGLFGLLAGLALTLFAGGDLGMGLGVIGLLPFMLGATQVGDITEQSTPDEHLVRDVSVTLSKLRPDRFALDTVMRRMEASNTGMPTEDATNTKIEWEEDDVIEYQTTLSGSTTAGNAGQSVDLTVNDSGVIRPKDMLYLPDNSNDPGAVLWVPQNGVSGTTITVYRLNMDNSESSFSTVPATSDGEDIRVLSRGKTEQDNASEAQGTMPAQLYNYCQILDQVVAASETRMATENYTEEDWSRNRDNNLFEFRRKLENAQVFGERMELTDPDTGKDLRFMGGITSFLSTNDLNYSAGGLTEGDLITFARKIFSGNNGSQLRFWFTTPNQQEEIDKILINSSTLQSSRDENVLGVEATRLHTSFGDLMFILNQGFAEIGKTNWGLILDPANVRRRSLRNMKINRNIQANDIDGRADQWIEECSIETRKEVTHGVVRDSSTDAFD